MGYPPENSDSWKAFLANDQVASIEFFTGMLAGLRQSNGIPPAFLVRAQEILAATQARTPLESRSVLHIVSSQGPELLQIFELRYGPGRLVANLFRFAWRQVMPAITRQLAEIGQYFVEHSSANFNRRMLAGGSDIFPEFSLISAVYTEVAKQLLNSAEVASDCLVRAEEFYPSSLLYDGVDDVRKSELEIAGATGFRTLALDCSAGMAESKIQGDLGNSLARTSSVLEEFAAKVGRSFGEELVFDLQLCCSRVRALSKQICVMELRTSGGVMFWEANRLAICSVLHQISDALRALQQCVKKLLPNITSAKYTNGLRELVYAHAARTTAYELTFKLGNALEAQQLAWRLADYCRSRNLLAEQLILAEAQRIDSRIDEDCLEVFQRSANPLVARGAEAKAEVLSASKMLESQFLKFSMNALTAIAFILFVQLTTACGIKTQPVSDREDFRPSLPFKESRGTGEKASQTPAGEVSKPAVPSPATQKDLESTSPEGRPKEH